MVGLTEMIVADHTPDIVVSAGLSMVLPERQAEMSLIHVDLDAFGDGPGRLTKRPVSGLFFVVPV